MLAEIRTVEGEAAAFFDQISRYFITRGKIVCKVCDCCWLHWYKVYYIIIRLSIF